MMIKASGRSALMVATGLFVCLRGHRTRGGAGGRKFKIGNRRGRVGRSQQIHQTGPRHWKKYAQRKYGKAALKSSSVKKADAKIADDDTGNARPDPAVGCQRQRATGRRRGARRQRQGDVRKAPTRCCWPAADNRPTPAGRREADAVRRRPTSPTIVDRTLQKAKPPAQVTAERPPQTVAMAPPPSRPARRAPWRPQREAPTWDQTSLIGKIFIAFGALLTMASAARMFMA